MPIYEYRCKSCGCNFEHLVLGSSNPAPQCPACCTCEVDKLISAGSFRPKGIPKGSGGFKASSCRPSGG